MRARSSSSVSFAWAACEQLVVLGQLAPQVGDAELGADAGEDFLDLLGRLRLLDVVVGPGVQADDLALGRPECREHDHRDRPQIGIDLERLAEGRAVHLGHLVVGQDQLGRELARLGQPFPAVDGQGHLVAFVLEQRGDHPPHHRAILDQQQPP